MKTCKTKEEALEAFAATLGDGSRIRQSRQRGRTCVVHPTGGRWVMQERSKSSPRISGCKYLVGEVGLDFTREGEAVIVVETPKQLGVNAAMELGVETVVSCIGCTIVRDYTVKPGFYWSREKAVFIDVKNDITVRYTHSNNTNQDWEND